MGDAAAGGRGQEDLASPGAQTPAQAAAPTPAPAGRACPGSPAPSAARRTALPRGTPRGSGALVRAGPSQALGAEKPSEWRSSSQPADRPTVGAPAASGGAPVAGTGWARPGHAQARPALPGPLPPPMARRSIPGRAAGPACAVPMRPRCALIPVAAALLALSYLCIRGDPPVGPPGRAARAEPCLCGP